MYNVLKDPLDLSKVNITLPLNIQHFAKNLGRPLSGSDELILIRIAGQAVDATKVMLLKEQARSSERDTDTESTVDGDITSGGTRENTVEFSAFIYARDVLIEEIHDAVQGDEEIPYEMWVINKKWKHETEDKYRAEYRQGYFTSFERSGEAGSLAEFEVEYSQYAVMQRGFATLPQAIAENKAQYGFVDTLASTPANGGLVDIPQPTAVQVNSVTLSKDTTTLAVNATEQLTATVDPVEATVTYTVTSGNEFATVTPTGLVKGVAEGTATITATAGDKTDTITVTVTPGVA